MATYRLSCFPDSRSWRRSAVLNRTFFPPQITLKNSPILMSQTILFKHFCFESAINRHHLSSNQNSNHFQNPKISDTGL